MNKSKLFRPTLCIAIATLLSGCIGGSGSGGGSGGGGSGDFETNYDAASGKAPTSDMPTQLQANYGGQFKSGVSGGGSVAGINENVEIIGDLDVAVDWTDGQSTNPFTGTASNIVVTDVVDGGSETLGGTLTVDNGIGGTIMRVATPASNIGGISVPAIETGSFQFGMTGQLSGSEGDLDATVLVGGNFHGPGAESMVGVVSGGFKEVGSTNPAIFDAGIGGVAYLNRE